MECFTYKEPYIEDGKKILEINVLPEKYCNFDCIFCPIGRSPHKIDTQKPFPNLDLSLNELDEMIKAHNPDLVFINSKGEALVNLSLIHI